MKLFAAGLSLIALSNGPSPEAPPERAWTLLVYGAVDNDAERSFVPDMGRLAGALPSGDAIQLVFLVDRSPEHSTEPGIFGEDFAGTRLYTWDGTRAVRESGGDAFPELELDGDFDANTGDPATLRKALRFAKERYPARHTGLILYSHGGGMSFCPDETAGGDELWTSDLTRGLTAAESVDLMVFDVCSMAAVENAYQWRPGRDRFSADVLVATPNAGFPFPWQRIFARVRAAGGSEGEPPALDPSAMEPADLGRLVVEETERARREQLAEQPRYAEVLGHEAMACLDLARATDVKSALDALARELGSSEAKAVVEAVRGEGDVLTTMNYFIPGEPCWNTMPYFDTYDLARRLAAEPGLSSAARERAAELGQAVDALVLASFGMSGFDAYGGFQPGRNGVHLTFPDGDAPFEGEPSWSRFGWYGPNLAADPSEAPGDYAFHRDGSIAGNGIVETWFELLDRWYDEGEEGGSNGVEW